MAAYPVGFYKFSRFLVIDILVRVCEVMWTSNQFSNC